MSERKPPSPATPLPSSRTTARRVDVAAMKAFAHPLRMQIYRHLQEQGAATSAQLARLLGESSGQTSYHLRQLERHGFVEEETGRGTARERWWRPLGFSFSDQDWAGDGPKIDMDRPEAVASRLVQRTQIEEYARSAHAWLDRAAHEEPTWRWTGTRSQTIATFTAEESIALNDALSAVVEEHVEAARERHGEVSGDAGAAGLRRVQLLIHSFPLPPARTV